MRTRTRFQCIAMTTCHGYCLLYIFKHQVTKQPNPALMTTLSPPPKVIHYLFVEPLQLILLGKHRPVLEASIRLIYRLLRVKTMKLGLSVLARVKQAEKDVARPILGQRRDAHAAKEVVPVRGGADADLVKVVDAEAGQVVVAEVGHGGKVLLLVLVVVAAEGDEFLLDGVLEFLEGFDGFGFGGVGRGPGVYGCFGGLWWFVLEDDGDLCVALG